MTEIHSIASRYWTAPFSSAIKSRFDLPRAVGHRTGAKDVTHLCTMSTEAEKFLSLTFRVAHQPEGEPMEPELHVIDPGKRAFSSFPGEGVEKTHEHRTRKVGHVSAVRLRALGLEKAAIEKMSFRPMHYLQRNPSLIAGMLHGLLDGEIKIQLFPVAYYKTLNKGSLPSFYAKFLAPLRKREGCSVVLKAKEIVDASALLSFVPHEERLFYLYEYERVYYEQCEYGFELSRKQQAKEKKKSVDEKIADRAVKKRPPAISHTQMLVAEAIHKTEKMDLKAREKVFKRAPR
mmetsp:Transcript_20241/g.81438  ORF Transcript_20241/g.81438 Transcript_20241/m.81438 type:complete len:290 (-) Transcript_20241:2157-3026(-)